MLGPPTTPATRSSIPSAPGADKTDIPVCRFLPWIGVGARSLHDSEAASARSTSTTPGPPRSLAHRAGEGGRPPLRPPAPLGRLSPPDLHDARRRHRRPQPRQRLPRPQGRRTPGRPDAADHLRQRAAIHRQGLQGVHPRLRHDPRNATLPDHPQSNGKIERWHKTLKGDCIRVLTPLSLDDARRIVADYVEHYNTVRLHSAIGYVTPALSRCPWFH